MHCEGFFASEVGRLVGAELSLVPINHQYVIKLITARVPALEGLKQEVPVLRDLEGSY